MFHVYIIESGTTGKWYYGFSERLEERIQDHNTNHRHYTGGKGPWKLIFQRPFVEKAQALLFEKKLKQLRNKEYIKSECSEYFVK